MPPTTEANWKLATEKGFQQSTPTIAGPLFQYCKNPDAVHCPGDKRYQLRVNAPSPQGRYSWDSYSGATFLNGEGRTSANNLDKRSGVTHPSDKIIWIEGADMRGENVGSWTMSDYGTASMGFSRNHVVEKVPPIGDGLVVNENNAIVGHSPGSPNGGWDI